MSGGGEHLPKGCPEPEGTVAGGQDGGDHAPALGLPQQVGPGLRRLPVALGEGHQLLGPSRRTPTMTSTHSALSSPRRTLTWMPSAQQYTYRLADRSRSAKAANSASQEAVSREITEADRPASVPKNSARAGAKSLVDSPCRYSSGSSSVTFGERRAYGGRIIDWKRSRCPVASSIRRSFTRGARTGTAPATVVTSRSRATPLRVTRARPRLSRSLAVAAR